MYNSNILTSCIITYGIISCTFLHGINNLTIIHKKNKYYLEIKQIEKNIDLSEKIKNEDKIISYYNTYYEIGFICILGFLIRITLSNTKNFRN